MNAESFKSAASSPSLFRNVAIVIVAALVSYLIYYLVVNKLLAGKDSSRAHMIPVAKLVNANVPAESVTQSSLALSPWSTGGEYTLSGWLYINDWNVNASNYKHVFSLESGSNMLMYAIIDQQTSTLIIRVLGQADSVATRPDLSKSGFTSMMTTARTSSGSGGGQLDSANVGPVGVAPCDVGELDIQRWIFVALAIRGRIVDIYMDGKLARQCVLPSMPAVTPGSLILRVGAAAAPQTAMPIPALPSFGGFISNVQTFSTALTPEAVSDAYQAGPEAPTGGWMSTLLQIFTVTVTCRR
jgi:hypothetical protein